MSRLKVQYNEDIRIFKLKNVPSLNISSSNSLKSSQILLNALHKFIQTSFNFKSIEDYKIQYIDSENDSITIITLDDLQDAIDYSNSKTPKIYVKLIKNKNKKNKNKKSKNVSCFFFLFSCDFLIASFCH